MTNKTKVYIRSKYNFIPTPYNHWENSTIEDADILISVDQISSFNSHKKKVLWLYEPESIHGNLYDFVKGDGLNYDFIATHRDTLETKIKTITLPPCFPTWIDENNMKIHEKCKNISMIASVKVMCPGHKYRQEIVNQFCNLVDVFGVGRKNEIQPKVDGLKQYRFSIAMENSKFNTYYTEKILDCFFTGTIPIYWGSENIYQIFDSNGIISLEYFLQNYNEFDFVNEYEIRKDAIANNFKKAKERNLYVRDGIDMIIEKAMSSTLYIF